MKTTRRQFLVSGGAMVSLVACGGIEPDEARREDSGLSGTGPETGVIATGATGDTAITGTTTTTLSEPVSQFQEWQDAANALEVNKVAGVDYFTAAAPGPWKDKIDVHLPVVNIAGTTCTLTLPDHPQDDEHHEDLIYVRDSGRIVIAMFSLAYGPAEGPATVSFELPPGTTSITPYASCNLHGLWKGDPYTV